MTNEQRDALLAQLVEVCEGQQRNTDTLLQALKLLSKQVDRLMELTKAVTENASKKLDTQLKR